MCWLVGRAQQTIEVERCRAAGIGLQSPAHVGEGPGVVSRRPGHHAVRRHDELVGRGGLYQRLYELQFVTSDVNPADVNP